MMAKGLTGCVADRYRYPLELLALPAVADLAALLQRKALLKPLVHISGEVFQPA
jgi:hypothetical protein